MMRLLAEAPAWIVELAGKDITKPGEDNTPLVELDSEEALRRAREHLRHVEPVGQGERNISAFRVAATLKDFGVSECENLMLLSELWNGEKCAPPLDFEELQRTVESAYRTGFMQPGSASPEHDFADVPTTDAPAQADQLKGDAPLRAASWLKVEIPDPDYLLGSWLHTTSRALIVGATGVGKTNFGLALAAHMAAGKAFLSWPARRPAKVLYVDGEMSRRLLKQRISDTCRRLGEVPDSLFVFSHESAEAFQPLNTPAGQKYMDLLLDHIGGVDFVLFDNIMSLLSGNMRETDSWDEVQPWVTSLTKRGIGQGWFHHTGHDESRSYGDKTKEWGMDTVLFLTHAKREGVDVSIDLEFRKARERTPENRTEFADMNVALVNDEWRWGAKSSRPSADEDFAGRARKVVGAPSVALRLIVEATEKAREGLDIFAPDPWIPVPEIAEQCKGIISNGQDNAQWRAFSRAMDKLGHDGLVEVLNGNLRLIR